MDRKSPLRTLLSLVLWPPVSLKTRPWSRCLPPFLAVWCPPVVLRTPVSSCSSGLSRKWSESCFCLLLDHNIETMTFLLC